MVIDMNLDRLDATALEYSQPLSVWRDWLPRLRYFTLYLATPGEADRDRFRLSLRYNDERDAAGILSMLGITSRPGHLRFDLESNLEGLAPNRANRQQTLRDNARGSQPAVIPTRWDGRSPRRRDGDGR